MSNPAEDLAPDEAMQDEGFTAPKRPGTEEPADGGGSFATDEDLGLEPEVLEAAAPEPEPEVTELTDEQRAQFSRLLNVGKMTRTVDVMGFSVIISTLNSDDEIRMFRACAGDENTAAYPRAYQTAMVAAGVISADKVNWTVSLAEFPDPDDLFRRKLEKARALHPLVIQYIYNEMMTLNTEFAELARTLGKLNG